MTEMSDRLIFRTLGYNLNYGIWCFEGILDNGNDTPEKFILNVNPTTGEAKVGERI